MIILIFGNFALFFQPPQDRLPPLKCIYPLKSGQHRNFHNDNPSYRHYLLSPQAYSFRFGLHTFQIKFSALTDLQLSALLSYCSTSLFGIVISRTKISEVDIFMLPPICSAFFSHGRKSAALIDFFEAVFCRYLQI